MTTPSPHSPPSVRGSIRNRGRRRLAQVVQWPLSREFIRPPAGTHVIDIEQRKSSGLAGFLLFVLLPTVLFTIYTAFFESPGYVADTRLALRGATEVKTGSLDNSLLSKLSSSAPRVTLQDSYIILNYVKSRAVVADLGGVDYLHKYFGKGWIDYFSRLGDRATIERATEYWEKRVITSIDTVSGIVTIKIDAYTPEDAQKIAVDVIRCSEALINKISLENRMATLQRTNDEMVQARNHLAATRAKLTAFRNSNSVIDPATSAKEIGTQLVKLETEKTTVVTAINTFSGEIDESAPNRRVMQARLESLNRQIAELRARLTSASQGPALSSVIGGYDSLTLEEQFAEKMYSVTTAAYDRARHEVDKQQIYLVTIVPPLLPEEATYPKILASSTLLFVSLFLAWAIISLVAAGIREQRT